MNIKKNNLDKDIEIYRKDFPNNIRESVFFEKLTLSINKLENKSGYLYSETDFNEGVLKSIKISIQYKFSKRINDCTSIIAHELTHAYGDYIMLCNGFTSFYDIFIDDNYDKYYNTIRDFNDYSIPNNLKQIRLSLYVLNRYERNGFISQICSEINRMKEEKQIKQFDKVLLDYIYENIKETDIYKSFMTLSNVIISYKNNYLSKKEIEIIEDEWENNYHQKMTISKIIKKLEFILRKTKQKIDTILTKKIYCESKLKYVGGPII